MTRRTQRPWAAAALAIGCAAIARPAIGQAPIAAMPGPPPVIGAPQPVPPTGPAAPHHAHPPGCRDCGGGPLRRTIRHTLFTLQDRFIGYPDQFVEPPLGFTLAQHLDTMKAKADPHEFFLYRSDFVGEGTALSPTGALRLTSMANRLPCWLGPLVVEWTPEQPTLAEARKAAILSAMADAGIPLDPDRILIGPSPYPGLIGDVAERYYPTVIQRSIQAPLLYSLPPTPTTTTVGGSGLSGGGRR